MPDYSEKKRLEEGKPSTSEYPTRIVVKFEDKIELPYEPGAERALKGDMRAGWDRIAKDIPGITLKPLYEADDLKNLRSLSEKAQDNDPMYRAPNFLTYFVIEMAAGSDGSELAKRLSGIPGVQTAYVEGGPVEPPVNAANDPRFPNQGYLQAAPRGVDAVYAWTQPGGDGLGVTFVDLEQGWTLNHEDLVAANISLISGMNQAYFWHGTSVLGEVVAVDNMRGGVGIAPQAWAQVVSQWRGSGAYNTSAAIASAATAMVPGDVLLLEAQTDSNGFRLVPVEVEQATFDAILAAVTAGLVVIEAAGNGANDLDTYRDMAGRYLLKRGDPDFRDSGAIVIGAGTANVPHSRWSGSNYGSRVDCYGWGEGIDTADSINSSTTDYRGNFGGTSGGSAMVAGVAVLVQSLSYQFRGRRYTPFGMRTLLKDVNRGTPSANPSTDRIGVMPDLRAIIDNVLRYSRYVPVDVYRALIQILFGIVNDAPGGAIGPDGRPIPVGPWDPTFFRLSAEHVDWLTGMALTEFAKIISDDVSAKEMREVGLRLIERTLDRFKQNL